MNTQALRQVPLSRKAMLVSLSIRRWNNRKLDETVTAQVASQHGIAADDGRYTKLLLPKEAFDEIGSLYATARVHYFENTLPWSDEGFRILPAKNYMSFQAEQQKITAAYDIASDDLTADLPKYIKEAKQRLNGLFNSSDYPTAADFRSRFSMSIKFSPFPDAEDFRVVELDPSEVERIRTEIETNIRETFKVASRDLWTRVHDAVKHTRDRLAAYSIKPDGKVENPFRDSVITNLQEIADLLPRLNVDDDPDLEDMRDKLVTSLCGLDPSALRDDPQQRVAAITDADSMLAAMAGYVGDPK